MKVLPVCVLLALSSAMLTGCVAPSEPTTVSRPVPRTGLLIEPLDALRIGYQVAWAGRVDAVGHIRSVTVLDDLVIVVEEPNNMVTALSLRDGAFQWAYGIQDASSKLFRPMRRESEIYVPSPTRMYTLSALDGSLKSVTDLDEVLACDPLLIDRTALCGSIDGTVYAHDVVSGFTTWRYDLTARIEAMPVEAGLNAFVADANGVYAMLSIYDDNHMLWRGRTFDAIRYPAAIDRLAVYVASQDQRLYALNRSNGREKWKLPMDRRPAGPPVAIGLNVYLPVTGDEVWAVDSIEGGVKWTTTGTSGPVVGDEQRLLLADEDALRIINPASGNEIATAKTKDLLTVIATPGNGVILVSEDGRMVRLDPTP